MTPADRDPTFLDYWRVLWRARWWILASTILAALVTFGIARALPKTYAARATVLPPKETNQGALTASLSGVLSTALGGREGAGLNLPGFSLSSAASLATNQDIFVAVLRARTMREDVIKHFEKTLGPDVGGRIGTVAPLADPREKGIISLTIEADDPKLASDVTNYYFEALDRKMEQFADQSVRRQETVYTAQLERAAKEVEAAESALLKFQTEHRLLAVGGKGGGGETGAATAASLRAQIQAAELQREVSRMKFTDRHPMIQEFDKQISELKRQYSRNLYGAAMELPPEDPGVRGSRREFFVSAERMTPVQFAFLKLARNLQIQEAFYTTALQGLQQIRYGEGVSYGRVIVLDPAIPPGEPIRPRVYLMVTGAAVAAAVLSILVVFFIEYLRRAQAREREFALATPRMDPGRRAPGLERTNGPTPLTPVPGHEPAST
jgi:tyrosine-protein kinase Etk/Wzc